MGTGHASGRILRYPSPRWALIALLALPAVTSAVTSAVPGAAPETAPGPVSEAASEAAARADIATFVDTLAPWVVLAAAAGPAAELDARIRHARLATAAQGPQAVAHWRRVVAIARSRSAHAARRVAQAAISNIGYRTGDLALTRVVEEESLADARRAHDRRGEAESLQDLGLVATVTGEPDVAEQRFRDAIAIWKTLDEPVGRARGVRGLARVLEMKGRYPQALQAHVEALELMLAHGTPIEQSESYYSLARLFLNLEDPEAGLRAIDQAIRLMGRSPPDFPLGLNLATRGTLLIELGRVDDAVAAGEGAIAAFDRAGAAGARAIGQLALGQALVLDGAVVEGLAMLGEATARATADGEKTLASDLHFAQGRMLNRLGRHADARAPLESAFALGDELGLDHLRQNVALEMETLEAALGRPEEALTWSRRAFEYRGRLTSLADLGALGAERVDGPAGKARARFMALEMPRHGGAAAAGVTGAMPFAADGGAAPGRLWWLVALPSLLLMWWLVRVLRSARRLRAERESLQVRQSELETAHHALQSQSERLKRQVAVDPLTGAMTRAAFAAELDALLQHAQAHDRPAALLVFDLDHFKAINDHHGHLAGDAALRLVTGIAREKLRSADLFGRFGGDEFLVAVGGMDGAGAEALAESIRFEVVWRAPDQQPPMPDLSISVGLAIADPGRGYDAESLFRRADGALYRAKRAGRNRVVADDPSLAGNVATGEHAPRQWTLTTPD